MRLRVVCSSRSISIFVVVVCVVSAAAVETAHEELVTISRSNDNHIDYLRSWSWSSGDGHDRRNDEESRRVYYYDGYNLHDNGSEDDNGGGADDTYEHVFTSRKQRLQRNVAVLHRLDGNGSGGRDDGGNSQLLNITSNITDTLYGINTDDDDNDDDDDDSFGVFDSAWWSRRWSKIQFRMISKFIICKYLLLFLNSSIVLRVLITINI